VVVYSAFEDSAHINAAYSMGVRGYLCKKYDVAKLEEVLETVLSGRIYQDNDTSDKLKTILTTRDLLSKRETEVFDLVRQGMSNRRIAEQLGISHRTVENVLCFIYEKTGISSRLELQKM
jgi:NarL family two-component system response regulator LiaR